MKTGRTELWTIHQLGAEVERVLAVDYAGSRNGRVRDIPDLRTIRYYTTAGLLERPAEMRGQNGPVRPAALASARGHQEAPGTRAEPVPGSGADRGCHRRDAPASRRRPGRGGCGNERGLAPSPGTGQNVAAAVLEISAGAGPHPATGVDESGDAKPPSLKGRAQLLRMRR